MFNDDKCKTCPLADKCNMKRTKKGRVLYFFTKEQLKEISETIILIYLKKDEN